MGFGPLYPSYVHDNKKGSILRRNFALRKLSYIRQGGSAHLGASPQLGKYGFSHRQGLIVFDIIDIIGKRDHHSFKLAAPAEGNNVIDSFFDTEVGCFQ